MTELELADWRRQVAQLYAAVRDQRTAAVAHRLWREGRDRLFREHPQSPLAPSDPVRASGLPYWPYDPDLRFELPLMQARERRELSLASGDDGVTLLRRIGFVLLPPPLESTLDVWWLDQYAGGLFLPLRDGTAGKSSYGGGRYLLDTAKGADLGSFDETLIIDLNFLYHPSCRYSDAWQCPLAPEGNRIAAVVHAGESL
ncbi:MAG: DUF1684 domain-containing protein [Actinomycetota bacterium]|nr:DUF1684 domain-containing protein [Actinomycetota bacterium]